MYGSSSSTSTVGCGIRTAGGPGPRGSKATKAIRAYHTILCMLIVSLATDAVSDPATSPPIVGALIAALGAVVLGIANMIVTIRQGSATRTATERLADREQWWTRFTWCLAEFADEEEDEDEDEDEERGLLAMAVLTNLAEVDWIQDSDRSLIASVCDVLNADVDEDALEEAQGAQNT